MGSHKEWRKVAKKLRRKRLRQKEAKFLVLLEESEQKKREASHEYQTWLAEQNILEASVKAETERIHDEEHEKWLRTELLAQQQWRQLQEKISKARFERAEQDLRIKKEWEEQQNKLKEVEEARKKIEEERLKSHRELMERIENFSSGDGDIPNELLIGRETNPDREPCLFFTKTGACRFGDNCMRNHRKPGVSKILLATNFYSHFAFEHSTPNEYDTDILLEYEDKDTYHHFKEFFEDVLPEFQEFGNIVQFKVCCNFERHLRGNTYIEYSSIREAVNAYRVFHGRWYGGKQVSLQFCDVPSWKRAICGLFADKRCPKGRACNFLHVFKNPGNKFQDEISLKSASSLRRHRHSSTRSRSKENKRNWRWSESPFPDTSDNKTFKPGSSSTRRLSHSESSTRSRIVRSSSRSRDRRSDRHSHHKESRHKLNKKKRRL